MQNFRTNQNVAFESPRTIVKQSCGTFVTAFFLLIEALYVINIFKNIILYSHRQPFKLISFGGALLSTYFFARVLFDKEYCSGKPDKTKIWPLAFGLALDFLKSCMVDMYDFVGTFILALIFLAIFFAFRAMYFGDDDSGSCCLCFKPWRLIGDRVIFINPQQYPQVYPNHPQQYPQHININSASPKQYPQIYQGHMSMPDQPPAYSSQRSQENSPHSDVSQDRNQKNEILFQQVTKKNKKNP